MKRSLAILKLERTGASQDEIAQRLAAKADIVVTRQAVSKWFKGHQPRIEVKKALKKLFGIPLAAWGKTTKATVEKPKANGHTPPAPFTGIDVDGSYDELERAAYDLMTYVRTDPDATPIERAKVMRSIAGTLHTLDQRQAGLEKRILQTPRWKRIERALIATLRGFPDALKAIEAMLEQLNEEGHDHHEQ